MEIETVWWVIQCAEKEGEERRYQRWIHKFWFGPLGCWWCFSLRERGGRMNRRQGEDTGFMVRHPVGLNCPGWVKIEVWRGKERSCLELQIEESLSRKRMGSPEEKGKKVAEDLRPMRLMKQVKAEKTLKVAVKWWGNTLGAQEEKESVRSGSQGTTGTLYLNIFIWGVVANGRLQAGRLWSTWQTKSSRDDLVFVKVGDD